MKVLEDQTYKLQRSDEEVSELTVELDQAHQKNNSLNNQLDVQKTRLVKHVGDLKRRIDTVESELAKEKHEAEQTNKDFFKFQSSVKDQLHVFLKEDQSQSQSLAQEIEDLMKSHKHVMREKDVARLQQVHHRAKLMCRQRHQVADNDGDDDVELEVSDYFSVLTKRLTKRSQTVTSLCDVSSDVIRHLREDCDAEKSNCEQLGRKNEELNRSTGKIRLLEEDLDGWEKKYRECEKVIREANQTIEDTRWQHEEDMKNASKDLEEARQECEVLREEKDDINWKFDESVTKFDEKLEGIDCEYNKVLQELQQRHEDEQEALRQEADAVRMKCEELAHQRAEDEAKLEKLRGEREEFDVKLRDLLRSRKDADVQHENMARSLMDCERELATATEKKEEQELMMKELRSHLAVSSEEVARLQDELQSKNLAVDKVGSGVGEG